MLHSPPMKRFLMTALTLVPCQLAYAGLLDVFELEDGHTNWQYVANTSATLLIFAMGYILFRLVRSHREAQRYNRQLEHRVQERTATLDESNRLLQASNRELEDEIAEHRSTTERLQMSESYITSILQSMPSMLIGLNADNRITQWNRRAQEISGLSSDHVLGRELWEAYPVITLSPEQIQAARKQNKPVSVKQSQRGQYYFDLTIYPLEGQSETGVVVMIDDVSQQVIAENGLIQRDKMSSMGELAASMAHDINTPLQGILEDIRQLQSSDHAPSPECIALLDDAITRGNQGSAVIANLLEFASSRAGEKKLADVTRILDRSVELANGMLTVPSGLSFSDVTIVRDYADDLPNIPCYPTELQQVFLSLLRHCCHALGQVEQEGFEPIVTLEAQHFYEALWIKVQHNGRGISMEEQQYIFEPFFTDTSRFASADYNAGRRLSFSHFIIADQHRGQLAVTSDVDIGTTFHIQLQLN
jgi:PAS domain S-box-containing protein